ncbi:hypothetical protein [Acidovorax sp. SUPP3334]|uniref:hypothetical protein n=1 Tax=Acidovorax sp. SUPP3334 TaxID=2920881 RepID=UPI0023DE2FD8|nr:hypothetical protein [Acidovorax sp. SUPP3334]GKT27113.1 3-oxoacyl-ACP synthase [Acidovorax sp. SUPP3334]
MPLYSPRPVLQIEHATLVTSLGDDWLTSVAAFTARRKHFRYAELDGTKLLTAPARDVAGESRGPARLRELLRAAWSPMATWLQALPPAPTLYLLALPEWMATPPAQTQASSATAQPHGPDPLQGAIDGFGAQCRRAGLPMLAVHAFSGGAETCHTALARAFRTLDHDLPPAQIVLIAADSLCDQDILLRDHRAGRIYDRDHGSGWVPGEAAACLLLRPAAGLHAVARNALALHAPCISDMPVPSPRWPSDRQGDGRALQQAMEGALGAAGLRSAQVSRHLSDSDGSRWRLEDETAALARMTAMPDAQWSAEPLQPAELLGQLGAAWGAVQWALAQGLHRHGLTRIDQALCTAQDISGRCSAGAMECGTGT